MQRIKTYIEGFDELVNGGFPQGSSILVNGPAGTGKTILCMEYLYNGAMHKEKGIYFTFEQKQNSLVEQATQFGWDIEKLQKKGMLQIIALGTEDFSKNAIEEIKQIIIDSKATRVVIDSLTTLSYLVPENSEGSQVNEHAIRRFLYQALSSFKELKDVTILYVSQKDDGIVSSLSQYLCDGLLNIEYESMGGEYSRHLVIRKMRQTKHNEDLHPIEISKKGVIVHKIE